MQKQIAAAPSRSARRAKNQPQNVANGVAKITQVCARSWLSSGSDGTRPRLKIAQAAPISAAPRIRMNARISKRDIVFWRNDIDQYSVIIAQPFDRVTGDR